MCTYQLNILHNACRWANKAAWVKCRLTSNYIIIFHYLVATVKGGKGEVPPSKRLGVNMAYIVLPVDMVSVDAAGDRRGMRLRGLRRCQRRRS